MNANDAKSPKKEQPFWSEDPNVIFNSEYIFEFYPTQTMTYNQKLNTLSRTIIILTIFTFLFTQSTSLLIISAITLLAIYYLYQSQLEEPNKDGFTTPAKDYLNENGIVIPADAFQEPSSNNPFSNVLVTDWVDNPTRKPAPPMGNPVVNDAILIQAKKTVSESNPGQPDIVNKLFKDVNEQLTFEQSMRQFHSTASTTIPNDQGAFAEFCYGGMQSCKEGNLYACARNTSHYTNY